MCRVGGLFRCAPVVLALVVCFLDELAVAQICVIVVPHVCLIRNNWPNALQKLNSFWLPIINNFYNFPRFGFHRMRVLPQWSLRFPNYFEVARPVVPRHDPPALAIYQWLQLNHGNGFVPLFRVRCLPHSN